MGIIDDLQNAAGEEYGDNEEFKALLDHISVNNLGTKEQLSGFLQAEINSLNDWLKKNSSTGSSALILIADKIARLEKYKTWKALCDKLQNN